MSESSDVRNYVIKVLGPPERWPKHPGGWLGQIEAALIDAVLSANSRYGGEESGVRAAVRRWRDSQDGRPLDHLPDLVRWVEANGRDAFMNVLGNRQRVPGRGQRPRKAEAVVAVATELVGTGVSGSADVDPRRHGAAFMSVRGVGPVTWRYFLMLLGTPGIKADRMIVRFAADALGVPRQEMTSKRAEVLLHEAATDIGVSPTQLDYAAWSYQRQG